MSAGFSMRDEDIVRLISIPLHTRYFVSGHKERRSGDLIEPFRDSAGRTQGNRGQTSGPSR